jgi:hypothetical protein
MPHELGLSVIEFAFGHRNSFRGAAIARCTVFLSISDKAEFSHVDYSSNSPFPFRPFGHHRVNAYLCILLFSSTFISRSSSDLISWIFSPPLSLRRSETVTVRYDGKRKATARVKTNFIDSKSETSTRYDDMRALVHIIISPVLSALSTCALHLLVVLSPWTTRQRRAWGAWKFSREDARITSHFRKLGSFAKLSLLLFPSSFFSCSLWPFSLLFGLFRDL